MKRMFSNIAILLAFTVSCFATDVQELVKHCVEEGYTKGMAVAVIDENGIDYYSYGHLSDESKVSVDENTLFEIGSVTKTITGLLLQIMIEKGEMDLNDPLEMYLPSYVKVPQYKNKKILLKHLANHTAGFPYMPTNFESEDMGNPFAGYTEEYLYDFLSNFEPPRAPGKVHEYSNISVGLLGFIISKKVGMPYEQLVREWILEPLQMNSTYVNVPESETYRFAKGHVGDAQVSNWDIPVLEGAGALKSCVADLARYVQANMDLIESDFSDAFKLMHKRTCRTKMPYIGMTLTFNDYIKFRPRVIWHNGGTGGYHSFIGFCPKTKKGVVILSNSITYIDDLGFHLLNEKHAFSSERKEICLNPILLKKYEGLYEHISGVRVAFAVNAGLLQAKSKLIGPIAVPIYPESDVRFFAKKVTADVDFELDREGNPAGFFVIYGNQKFWMKKIQ
ncbi:MAG TPA: serine hydrolase domain-containing protein [Chlamydiales bacterium]|nr:serine hydrolase domain-containing protein [Chlamydiales bacterium]